MRRVFLLLSASAGLDRPVFLCFIVVRCLHAYYSTTGAAPVRSGGVPEGLPELLCRLNPRSAFQLTAGLS